jgi:hypothetical protein
MENHIDSDIEVLLDKIAMTPKGFFFQITDEGTVLKSDGGHPCGCGVDCGCGSPHGYPCCWD